MILAALAALPTTIKADFAFECTFAGNVFGGQAYAFYSETCTQFGCTDCKAYEVLCTNPTPPIEKATLDYANNCSGCLCNINDANWAFTSSVYPSALPTRQYIDLPAWTELSAAA